MTDWSVRVETIEITEAGSRQIPSKAKVAELLPERGDDIRAAVVAAADVVPTFS